MDAVRTNRIEAPLDASTVHMENCIELALLGKISIAAQLDDGHRVTLEGTMRRLIRIIILICFSPTIELSLVYSSLINTDSVLGFKE